MPGTIWKGSFFNAFVLVMLALDLGAFHRTTHTVKLKEALTWSAAWIALALAYNGGIYYWMNQPKAVAFLTGSVIEKSSRVEAALVEPAKKVVGVGQTG